MSYSSSPVDNKLRIRARDPDKADRIVDLTKLTTKDLVCWFHRGSTMFSGHNSRIVRFEPNPDFNPDRPLGYQWIRIQTTLDGREWTRQALCMFCQKPTFNPLTGYQSIIRHFMRMHPHEVPPFVERLIRELGLTPAYEARDMIMERIPYTYGQPLRVFLAYLYRKDGYTNQLRFAPRSHVGDTKMKLSEVSERNVLYWFWRDIGDFPKYHHQYARYFEYPQVDSERPELSQIYRVGYTDQAKTRYKMELCMHCQEPKFFSMHGDGGLLAHIVVHHWGVGVPSDELVVQWSAQSF